LSGYAIDPEGDTMRRLHASASLVSAFFAVLCGSFATSPTCRAADGDSDPPYQVKVVLDIAKNRVFTQPFREQIQRELQDGIQAALGDIARVKVTDTHAKLDDIHRLGLGPALDNWRETSREKTHFVLIDLVDNEYQIQARQFDGPSGTASPVVRLDRTPDRAFVARLAALLIERDFGFTASFRSWPKGADPNDQPQPVQLTLDGGRGVPLSRWVHKGDVFAVVNMSPPGGGAPRKMDWCLVQLQDPPPDDSTDGICTGRLFWRYTHSSDSDSLNGYRCIKLGAILGPAKLRMVKTEKDKIIGPMQGTLELRRFGFKGEEGTLVNGAPDERSGVYSSASNPKIAPFDRVAFITVRRGGIVRAYLPFPILDDHATVVPFSSNTDQIDALAQRIERWKRHVNDALQVRDTLVVELTAMGQKSSIPREQVIARANQGLKRISDDYNRLIAEKEELQRLISSRKPGTNNFDNALASQDANLKRLKDDEGDLTKYIAKQEEIFKNESSPSMRIAKAQIADAELALQRFDYDQAIDLLRQAQKELKDEKLQQRINELETQWMPISDEQKAARKFIYEVFPNLDTSGLGANISKARKDFEICKSAGDKITSQKLAAAIKNHITRLLKEKSELNPVSEGDQVTLEKIGKVAEALQPLYTDVLAFCDTDKK
jgi:hypothetical protein